jgi:hypothetical protein
MNKFLKEYISLKENFVKQNESSESVLALYEFADRLLKHNEKEAIEVLVDVYQQLYMMESAYKLYADIYDKKDKKQLKKFSVLEDLSKSHGDRFATKRPLNAKEKIEKNKRKKLLPKFKYHPDPVGTGAFIEGEAMICPCCGKGSTVYYATIPYSRENVENLCPVCISNGEAAKKFDAEFIQDAEWNFEPDEEKNDELFHRTPGYLSWQGEYWLSCCNDYCAYLGSVGTKELNEMGIADEVFKEYNKRNEFDDIEEYLVKDGSVCGYLFRCLHCGKHHLWVDAD